MRCLIGLIKLCVHDGGASSFPRVSYTKTDSFDGFGYMLGRVGLFEFVEFYYVCLFGLFSNNMVMNICVKFTQIILRQTDISEQ